VRANRLPGHTPPPTGGGPHRATVGWGENFLSTFVCKSPVIALKSPADPGLQSLLTEVLWTIARRRLTTRTVAFSVSLGEPLWVALSATFPPMQKAEAAICKR